MVRVHEVMVTDAPLASVPGNRLELLRLFAAHHVSGFAVVKTGTRKLAGVVTRADLLRRPHENQTALLMNPNPNTMYAQAHLQEAARLMAEARVSILPVVSGSNDVLGVLSTSEVLESLTQNPGRVQTYMPRRVTPIHQGTPAPVAKEILDITRAPALPVLDDLGRLVGIVTEHDLLQHAAIRQSASQGAEDQRPGQEEWEVESLRSVRGLAVPSSELRLPDVPVSEVMVREVATVGLLTTIGEAASLMLSKAVAQLPVVDDKGRLLDLLTDLDLVAALH